VSVYQHIKLIEKVEFYLVVDNYSRYIFLITKNESKRAPQDDIRSVFSFAYRTLMLWCYGALKSFVMPFVAFVVKPFVTSCSNSGLRFTLEAVSKVNFHAKTQNIFYKFAN